MTIMKLAGAGIPQILVNARLSERSFRGWNRFGGAARSLFSRIGLCLAQTEQDGERYRALGVPRVSVTGNLKFDVPPPAADPAAVAAFQALLGNRPVWVAASTHEGEEEIVAAAHQLLRAAPSRARHHHRAAPPEPRRGDPRAAQRARPCGGAARAPASRSVRCLDVYLADTLGELGLFYRVAPVAFLGGSLVAHGGQNPIEPVRLDAAILHGPHVHNFAGIYAALDGAGAAEKVIDAESLAGAVAALLDDASALAPPAASRRPRRSPPCRARSSGRSLALAPYLAASAGEARRRVRSAPAFWWRRERSAAALALAPLAWLWGASSARRMARPPAFTAPVPVICVGNFVVGGAGKTPTAIALARIARARGFTPGFLASGYGGEAAGPLPGRARLRQGGRWSATRRCCSPRSAPTVIGRDRAAAREAADRDRHRPHHHGRRLPESRASPRTSPSRWSIPDVGLGNGRVIPAGPLRAPLQPQLRRADALIVVGEGTAADPLVRSAARAGRVILPRAADAGRNGRIGKGRRSSPSPASAGRRNSTQASPRSKAPVGKTVSFADHYRYSEADAERLIAHADAAGLRLVTTEKDMARLAGETGASPAFTF